MKRRIVVSEDLSKYVTYELIQYVWGELRCHSPNATSIDAEMVIDRVLRGESGDMVTRFRVPPDVADCIWGHIRRSVAHLKAVSKRHSR